MIYALIALAVVVVFIRRRAARKNMRAGLNNERPVFSIEPPARRMGDRRREAL